MTNEERAREAAEKVLIDLSGRSGMNLLDQIRWDDPELWEEIIGDGSSIILTALNAATAELEEERGRLRELLGQIVRGVDEKHVLIEGPVVTGLGTPDDIYVGWDWAGEWLHHVRSALAKKEPSNG